MVLALPVVSIQLAFLPGLNLFPFGLLFLLVGLSFYFRSFFAVCLPEMMAYMLGGLDNAILSPITVTTNSISCPRRSFLCPIMFSAAYEFFAF